MTIPLSIYRRNFLIPIKICPRVVIQIHYMKIMFCRRNKAVIRRVPVSVLSCSLLCISQDRISQYAAQIRGPAGFSHSNANEVVLFHLARFSHCYLFTQKSAGPLERNINMRKAVYMIRLCRCAVIFSRNAGLIVAEDNPGGDSHTHSTDQIIIYLNSTEGASLQ